MEKKIKTCLTPLEALDRLGDAKEAIQLLPEGIDIIDIRIDPLDSQTMIHIYIDDNSGAERIQRAFAAEKKVCAFTDENDQHYVEYNSATVFWLVGKEGNTNEK